ncbi:MAG: hypothetical protein MI923_22835 [Phycisphaerales bacterium]|nr:hypothetical protein [Phycisphaerales bacterium]
MFKKSKFSIVCPLLTVSLTALAVAQDFSLDWYTFDGGGGYSSGGSFELEGTIGQPDAGFTSGGAFELDGGFWPGSVPSCGCLGDMNSDGARDGSDIQAFVVCILQGGSCACADVDGLNGLSIDDVDVFVTDLLAGNGCP